MSVARVLLLGWLLLLAGAAGAEIRVRDDAGREVVLRAPAQRVVSLAPHATEMLFEIGAGSLIVGAVEHSDHPEAAKRIPRVGNNALLDMERIVALRPDLVVVWLHGNSERHLARLRKLGVPLFESRPTTLAAIATTLSRLGRLTGREAGAERAAAAYTARLEELTARYASRAPVRLFFQVWERPLLTVGGGQVISDAIRTCGARNVFEEATMLVPTVDVESVVRARPEAVVRAGRADDPGGGFALWRRLPAFEPTARGNLLVVDSEALARPSARVLEGLALLCEQVDHARRKRDG